MWKEKYKCCNYKNNTVSLNTIHTESKLLAIYSLRENTSEGKLCLQFCYIDACILLILKKANIIHHFPSSCSEMIPSHKSLLPTLQYIFHFISVLNKGNLSASQNSLAGRYLLTIILSSWFHCPNNHVTVSCATNYSKSYPFTCLHIVFLCRNHNSQLFCSVF